MAKSCAQPKSKFLSKEVIDEILNEHKGFFIEGLDFTQQRAIVKSIANELYRGTIISEKSSPNKIKEETIAHIDKELADHNDALETLQLLDDVDGAEVVQEQVDRLNTIKSNLDLLFNHANDLIKSFNGIVAKDPDSVVDKLKDSNEESEEDDDEGNAAGLERTNYSETFYLELDSKDTMGAHVKKFLAFVEKKEFINGVVKPVLNVLGKQDYHDFDYIVEELHRMLEGVKASQEDVISRLEVEASNAELSNNNTLAWVKDFIEYYKAANNDIKAEFVSEMAKHKIEMKYVDYNVLRDKNGPILDKQGHVQYQLFLNNDDSGSITQRTLKSWKKSHATSDVVRDGVYSKQVKEELKIQLNSTSKTGSELVKEIPESYIIERFGVPLKSLNKDQYKLLQNELLKEQDIKKSITTSNVLASLGIYVEQKFLDRIFVENKGLYVKGLPKKVFRGDILGVDGKLDTIIKNLPEGKTPEEYDFIKDGFINALANGNSRFQKQEFSSSFRVGDKTIYTYTMNHYLSNRIRDLKGDDVLLNQLNKSLFVEDSLYLSRLLDADENNYFRDWFDMGYLSLNPLKVRKGKRSDNVTTISPLDFEVTKFGHYNSGYKYDTIEVNGVEHQVRKAVYYFPTNSDKTRVMTVNGLAFDTTDVGSDNVTRYKDDAIKLFYDSVVLPEMKRINQTSSPKFKKQANLKNYNGGIFYLVPELNELTFDITNTDGTVTKKLFLDYVKSSVELDNVQQEAVNGVIRKFLNTLAEEKITKWKELGIIDKNGNLAHIPKQQSSRSTKANPVTATIYEMAKNEVFNFALANANAFQLVIGDPAQYNKPQKNEGIELQDIIKKNRKEVNATMSNISKRLAAEIAPGIEMEGEDYLQVFIDDIKSESVSLDYLKGLLGEEEANSYSKMNEADAQEYTTWREHLNILKYLGRITEEEYKVVEDAYSAPVPYDPPKDLFDKVLQPLKPVYAYNDVQLVNNALFIDRKTYIKSSSFPLIPTLTKGLQIDRLREAMEKLENSNKEKLGVRASFASAVKVGFPAESLELHKDVQGTLVDEIDLTGKAIKLKRSGFRIQQDIPYDPLKEFINDGTQQKKLLFANYNNPELEQEYTDTYEKLYLLGKQEFEENVLSSDGTVDVDKLATELSKELDRRGEISKPLRDGLKILNGEFAVPLWMSPYADTYASLLNSIVKNAIIHHKLPGTSKILGARTGFKPTIKEGEEAAEWVKNNETGIVFTDSYNPVTGLQGQREEDGVIKPAQVMVKWNFKDNEGNLLNIKDFMVDNMIDTSKLPKEVMQSFGFRIPTQLHASMAFMEIVGFLPTTSGDLIIAPAEFTVQMGSDFDVDKLYMYMYSTEYNKETGELSKAPLIEDYEYMKTLVNPKDLSLLKKKYKAGLHNKLLDIHFTVMKDKTLQKDIHSPLGFGELKGLIKQIEDSDDRIPRSVLSDQYQEDKFYDGTAGKAGVGFFSSYSIFNALAQGKNFRLVEQRETKLSEEIPVSITFGNQYNPSEGDLSSVYSLKKKDARKKTDVMAADQNLSVDNANEQGMHVINLNDTTFGVKALLTCLGFEEDVAVPFIAQPIIREYSKRMKMKNSILTEYDPEAENKIIEDLKQKYGEGQYNSDKHLSLADFKGLDASKTMLSFIKNGKMENQFGLYQAAILDKFIEIKKLEKNIGPVKQLLNLDSKGFSKNMFINKRRLGIVYKSGANNIIGVERMFGELTKEGNMIPTTTAGFDNIWGTGTLVDKFGSYFLESNNSMEFANIVAEAEKILGRDGNPLTEQQLIKLKNNYKNYLLSNLKLDDIDAERNRLLVDENFYNKLSKFKETEYGKQNKFLAALDISFNKFLEIDYNNAAGDNFDESSIYKSFIDLFRDSNDRNGVIPSELGEDLILYSLLRGGNKANQFLKFIPIKALNHIVDIPAKGNTNIFIDQWIRHNSFEAVLIPKDRVVRISGSTNIAVAGEAPIYIRVENKPKDFTLYKFSQDLNKYVPVNELGVTNTTEYTPYAKNNSVFKTNNKFDKVEDTTRFNPLVNTKEVEYTQQPEGAKVNSEVTTDELNFNSINELLQSIVDLNEPKYKEQSKLATVLLNSVRREVKVITEDIKGSFYQPSDDTIHISNSAKTGKGLLISILHETLHSMSSEYIRNWENGIDIPVEVKQALIRLNALKNTSIDSILKNDSSDFKLYFTRLFNRYWDNIERRNKLYLIISDKSTVHGKLKEIARDVIAHRTLVDANKESNYTAIQATLASDENIDPNKESLYYSLMDLKEFVAVAGTLGQKRKQIIELAGNKYVEEIKNLFQKVLEFLGITNEESAKFLNDIFTVSGVKEEKVVEPVQQPITKQGEVLEDIQDSTSVKEGVDFVFEENKELSSIGTKQQYSRYLDTIFPESKVKDIVYHGSKNKTIERFSKSKFLTGEGAMAFGKGFYFTEMGKGVSDYYSDMQYKYLYDPSTLDEGDAIAISQMTPEQAHEEYGGKKYSIILNITNPIVWGNTNKQKQKELNEGNYDSNDAIIHKSKGFTKLYDSDKYQDILWGIESYNMALEENTYGDPDEQLSIEEREKIKNKLKELELEKTKYSKAVLGEIHYIVPEPEQIHILGSKQDVQGFKDFVQQETMEDFDELEEIGEELKEKCKGNEGTLKAKDGMVISNKSGNLETTQEINTFTQPLHSSKWTLVNDLKGPSHKEGGIGLSIEDGNVHFTRGESKIHAKCGCLVRHKEEVSEAFTEAPVFNKKKFGRK